MERDQGLRFKIECFQISNSSEQKDGPEMEQQLKSYRNVQL